MDAAATSGQETIMTTKDMGFFVCSIAISVFFVKGMCLNAVPVRIDY